MEESILLEKVHALRRRLRWVRSVESALAWTAPGMWLALSLVLVLKLGGRGWTELSLALAAVPLFVVGGGVARWFRPPGLLEAAYATDQELNSRERLLTAAEWVLREKPRTAVAASLLQDAAVLAREVDPGQLFEVRRPGWRPVFYPGLLAGLLLALPAWHLFVEPPGPEAVRVGHSARTIQQLAEQVARRPENQRLARELEKLARDLKEPGVSPAEAAERIARKRRELRRGEGQGKADTSPEGLAEKLRALAKQKAESRDSKAMKEALEAAKEALEKSGQSSSAAEQAQQALESGQEEALSQATEQVAGALEKAGAGEQELMRQVDEALAQQQGELSPGQLAGDDEGLKSVAMGEGGEDGQGEVEADFGKGTTNQEEPATESAKNRAQRQSDRTSDWTEEYQKLYESQRVERTTTNTQVKGQRNQGTGYLDAPGEARGAPSTGGEVSTQAQEVFLEHRREAEQAVAREAIPAEYRDTVRNYFDTIDPRS